MSEFLEELEGDLEDGMEEYEVERILKKKVTKDERGHSHIYYLVHWKGYAENQATWEPTDNLQNALEKVRDFERKRWEKGERKQPELKAYESQPRKKLRKMNRIVKQDVKLDGQFEIIGAKKSDITFFLRFSDGRVQAVTSKHLKQINPQKLIQFYEKHIKPKPSPVRAPAEAVPISIPSSP